MNETRYPLCWPANWKRSQVRTRAQFGKVRAAPSPTGYAQKGRLSIAESMGRIESELRRFSVKEETVVISTNLPVNIYGSPRGDRGEPSDTGVAVYWQMKGKSQCMAIDTYDRVADNLAAVAATLEAMRAIERHGGATILDRAFLGFAALPAQAGRPWRDVLQFGLATPTWSMVEERFRALSRSKHPDAGGTHEAMSELNQARAHAKEELRA